MKRPLALAMRMHQRTRKLPLLRLHDLPPRHHRTPKPDIQQPPHIILIRPTPPPRPLPVPRQRQTQTHILRHRIQHRPHQPLLGRRAHRHRTRAIVAVRREDAKRKLALRLFRHGHADNVMHVPPRHAELDGAGAGVARAQALIGARADFERELFALWDQEGGVWHGVVAGVPFR